MKIDNLAVDRFNTAETTIPRQGSRQVEQATQQTTQQKSQALTKNQAEKKVTEKEVDRTKEHDNNMKELKEAIDQANKSFKPMSRRFEYSVHESLQRVSIKVIDSNTDEMIREIPSEKLLDMVANMLEVAGIIVDERG